jgi:hypothetical protein
LTLCVSLAITLGALLRLVLYLRNRSLWYDEALLALNILHRPFVGLLDTLDYHQGAPIGFLLLEKLATKIGGGSEFVLRFVPLLFGIGALFLFSQVARACLSRRAAPLAILLFAINEPLIYYSSEVKQYSCDVAITLFLLWAIARFLPSEMRIRSFCEIGLLGAAALWFSYPASFLLAGSSVVLLVAVWRKSSAYLIRVVWIFTPWGISFALLYLLSLRGLGEDRVLTDFWHNYFPPPIFWSRETVQWLADRGLTVLGDPRCLATVLSGALFAAGCGGLILKRKGDLVWLISSACFMTLLASYLHKYPFAGRLLLFAVPIALLGVAEGAIWLADTILWRSSVARFGLVVMVLAQPVWLVTHSVISPRRPDDIKPAIDYVLAHQQAGDVVYVYSQAQYQFRYYADLRHLTLNVHFGANCAEAPSCYKADLDSLRKPRRVWVLFSHILVREQTDEEQIVLSQLDWMGTRHDEKRSPGARAYLYDLSAESANPSPRLVPSPANRSE